MVVTIKYMVYVSDKAWNVSFICQEKDSVYYYDILLQERHKDFGVMGTPYSSGIGGFRLGSVYPTPKVYNLCNNEKDHNQLPISTLRNSFSCNIYCTNHTCRQAET